MAGRYKEREDHDLALKRSFMLSERARSLVSQMKFYEAITLLEDIEDSLEETTASVALLKSECYVQLGREMKAEKIIKKFRRMVLAHPTPSIPLVVSLGDGFDGIPSYVRAMIVRKLIGEMYMSSELSPTEKFEGMCKNLHSSNLVIRVIIDETQKGTLSNIAKTLLQDTKDISSKSDSDKAGDTQSKVRLFTIAMDYGIQYMEEMFENLEQLRGVEERKRARDLAQCTNAIGYLYGQAQEHQKSIKWRKKGIQLLEGQFGNSASDYNLYGDLFHNIGVCLSYQNKYAEAERSYLKAIDIYYKASDYGIEAQREKDLQQSRGSLAKIRPQLT